MVAIVISRKVVASLLPALLQQQLIRISRAGKSLEDREVTNTCREASRGMWAIVRSCFRRTIMRSGTLTRAKMAELAVKNRCIAVFPSARILNDP